MVVSASDFFTNKTLLTKRPGCSVAAIGPTGYGTTGGLASLEYAASPPAHPNEATWSTSSPPPAPPSPQLSFLSPLPPLHRPGSPRQRAYRLCLICSGPLHGPGRPPPQPAAKAQASWLPSSASATTTFLHSHVLLNSTPVRFF